MISADPEYYRSLKKELTTQGRWFTAATAGFNICLLLAFNTGVNDGWPWLLGALFALSLVLWARIDLQTTRVLLQIYLANAK